MGYSPWSRKELDTAERTHTQAVTYSQSVTDIQQSHKEACLMSPGQGDVASSATTVHWAANERSICKVKRTT